MNLFAPKTFNLRQQILDFLSEKRKATNLKKNDVNESSFTITEISEHLNIMRNLVDAQMDVLYKLKQVECLRDDIKENKFFINDAGFYASASKEPLNEGKLLNSQIFSNYSNSLFQIITAILALYTVYKSFNTVDAQNIKIEQLHKSIIKLEEQSISREKADLNLISNTSPSPHLRTNKADSMKKVK